MHSQDLEDLINLVDGRESLSHEVEQAEAGVRRYIGQQFCTLLKHRDFEYLVQGNLPQRSELFFARWERISKLAG